ncbi:uncharacterized protein LOC143940873 [Lithobates pipiens]
MLQQTLCLSLLLAVIGICSTDDIPVISGVFMPNNINVDYDGAKTACAMHYSRLATLDEITTAFKKGYEFCKWGWIVEHKLVMLRLTPFESCAGYNMGILIRDCPLIYSVFCANGGGSINVTTIKNRVPSYENASLACMDIGSVATKQQIEANISNIPDNTIAWYNWGVGEVKSGVFAPSVCNDASSQASAFCYNPSLADVIINSDDQIWKTIVMACLLSLIFIVLLFAAVFMKGNKFICCMGPRKTEPQDVVQSPTWNNTGIYRRISVANKGVLYDNLSNIDKRASPIRPEMNLYKTHYTNMAFDTIGEE